MTTFRLLVACGAICLASPPVHADEPAATGAPEPPPTGAPAPPPADAPDPAAQTTFSIGGYAQPQLKLRENSDAGQFDEDGFRLVRSRLTVKAKRPAGQFDVGFELEAELTPEFQLLDAFVKATGELPHGGAWRANFGQVKAPFSRQTMASDAELQFVEKAMITHFAPDRQLGVRTIFNAPYLPMLEVSGGVFNGEGRNQLENIDENFLLVGRLAVRPIGHDQPLHESAFGADQVSIAANVGYNVEDTGNRSETSLLVGADAFVSMHGVSGYAELFWSRTDDEPEDASICMQAGMEDQCFQYKSKGLNVQLGYLLPLPGFWYRRVEVAGRWEEADARFPNDEWPISQPGDAWQAVRRFVGGLSYYHDEHDLKAQLAFIRNLEVEDRYGNSFMQNAKYSNDTLFLQVTYRLK